MSRAAVLLAVLFVSACTVWPVGQDPYGMNLRREANRTIMALQSYHHDHGAFPTSLASLTPQYLPRAAGRADPALRTRRRLALLQIHAVLAATPSGLVPLRRQRDRLDLRRALALICLSWN